MSSVDNHRDKIKTRLKTINQCRKLYGLAPNTEIDETLLSYRNFPSRSSKKLAVIIAAYKKEATSEILGRISAQQAGIVRALRNDGFIFQPGTGSGETFLYKNSRGKVCGFRDVPIQLTENVQQLLNKSVAACLSAIEVYNKPDFKYREETFSILMVNAWELLLKARCIGKDGKTRNIQVIDGGKVKTNRCGNPMTISIEAAADKLVQDHILDDRCRKNIDLLVEFRDNAVHFINKHGNFSRKVLEVGMATLRNYITIVEKWFGRKFYTLKKK